MFNHHSSNVYTFSDTSSNRHGSYCVFEHLCSTLFVFIFFKYFRSIQRQLKISVIHLLNHLCNIHKTVLSVLMHLKYPPSCFYRPSCQPFSVINLSPIFLLNALLYHNHLIYFFFIIMMKKIVAKFRQTGFHSSIYFCKDFSSIASKMFLSTASYIYVLNWF